MAQFLCIASFVVVYFNQLVANRLPYVLAVAISHWLSILVYTVCHCSTSYRLFYAIALPIPVVQRFLDSLNRHFTVMLNCVNLDLQYIWHALRFITPIQMVAMLSRMFINQSSRDFTQLAYLYSMATLNARSAHKWCCGNGAWLPTVGPFFDCLFLPL